MESLIIVARLEITLDTAGNVSVSGPIDNKMLSYGLLEVAKEVIRTHCEKAQQRIQPAPAGVVDMFNRKPS